MVWNNQDHYLRPQFWMSCFHKYNPLKKYFRCSDRAKARSWRQKHCCFRYMLSQQKSQFLQLYETIKTIIVSLNLNWHVFTISVRMKNWKGVHLIFIYFTQTTMCEKWIICMLFLIHETFFRCSDRTKARSWRHKQCSFRYITA